MKRLPLILRSFFAAATTLLPLVMDASESRAEEPKTATQFLHELAVHPSPPPKNAVLSAAADSAMANLKIFEDPLFEGRSLDTAVAAIRQTIQRTPRIYPVHFRLCEASDDVCGLGMNSLGIKAEPSAKLVLVDVRDEEGSWPSLDVSKRRKQAMAAFAELATRPYLEAERGASRQSKTLSDLIDIQLLTALQTDAALPDDETLDAAFRAALRSERDRATAEASERLTSAEFFATLAAKPEADRMPPAHPFASELIQEALVGLKKLEIIFAGDAQKIARLKEIRAAIAQTRIYVVGFRLCEDDSRSDCSEDTAYALRNFPTHRAILIDGRDLPGRWKRIALSERQRLAVHEFGGLATVEIENHALSAQVDDDDTFAALRSASDYRRYFDLMKDYFSLLPGGPKSTYDGTWVKRSVLFPTKLKVSRDASAVLTGDKCIISFEGYPGGVADGRREGDTISSGANRYPPGFRIEYPNPADFGLAVPKGFEGRRIVDPHVSAINGADQADYVRGGIESHSPGEAKRHGRFAARYRSRFDSSTRDTFPELECRLTDEDRLMCRNIYFRKQSLGLSEIFVRDSEYAFYERYSKPRSP